MSGLVSSRPGVAAKEGHEKLISRLDITQSGRIGQLGRLGRLGRPSLSRYSQLHSHRAVVSHTHFISCGSSHFSCEPHSHLYHHLTVFIPSTITSTAFRPSTTCSSTSSLAAVPCISLNSLALSAGQPLSGPLSLCLARHTRDRKSVV